METDKEKLERLIRDEWKAIKLIDNKRSELDKQRHYCLREIAKYKKRLELL